MAEFRDLDRCDYFPLKKLELIAIGWLGNNRKFATGSVDAIFFNKLKELAQRPWQPVLAGGVHFCELCEFEPPGFSLNLFIPYQGRIYVTPESILHYIASHWYRPPDIFIEAVLHCPPINSMEYKKALFANGGRSFAKDSIKP